LNCLTIDFTFIQPVLVAQLVLLGIIVACYFLDRRKRKEELEQIMRMKNDLFQLKASKE